MGKRGAQGLIQERGESCPSCRSHKRPAGDVFVWLVLTPQSGAQILRCGTGCQGQPQHHQLRNSAGSKRDADEGKEERVL